MKETKYIFVTGGVCSSLGKGIAASSIGALIEAHGYQVNMVKIDPYLNLDAGTMSPLQHGEVYVTEDGAETDLDLGNYERFTHHTSDRSHSITTGQIYQSVIEKEREGGYLGECIQLIPHITNTIKERIQAAANPSTDVVITEIGGTVGDIESNPFLEAARQMIVDLGKERVLFVHVTYIPLLRKANELKTKPTQHSVQKLRELGIQPDVLLCRIEEDLPRELKKKIALFTQVKEDAIIEAKDCPHSIYEVPLAYHAQKLNQTLLQRLSLPVTPIDIKPWKQLLHTIQHLQGEVEIALVGKYVSLKDAYLSVHEALTHAGFARNIKVKVRPVDSEHFTETALHGVHGILIPGGFGSRGIPGKIAAAHYAYTHKIPFFGICLGMQIMTIAHAQHILRLKEATSEEFDPDTPHPVIHLLPSQEDVHKKGGTMRLGAYTSQIRPGTLLEKIYGTPTVSERHRHRYEFNMAYAAQFEESGLHISCTTGKNLVEAVEWDSHPFAVGVQYHPEFTSKPTQPNPIFDAFIQAAKHHQSQ